MTGNEGLELDIVCALTDTFREDGTNSVINLTLSGTAGTPIPQGSQVKNTNAFQRTGHMMISIVFDIC